MLANLFSEYRLNYTKRLDFEDWKKAFELYTIKDKDGLTGKDLKIALAPAIDDLKSKLNRNRPYNEVKFEDIKITKYWLLGFIEGEGNFSVEKKHPSF